MKEALINSAGVAWSQGDWSGVVEACTRLLELAPNDPTYLCNRAAAQLNLSRYEEALADSESALALQPDLVYAQYGRALALFFVGRREESLAQLDAIAVAQPGAAEPVFAKSIRLLSMGRYAEAWSLYERRWDAALARMAPRRDLGEPVWNGARVEGLVRIWAEQGPGDQILHARFLREALTRTPRVAYSCSARFAPLIARSFPALERVAAEEAFQPAAAAQAPLASLAGMFGVTPQKLRGAAYLVADPARVAALREKYRALAQGKPVIGLAWSSQNAASGKLKSAALTHWAPVLSAPYWFVNLQYGDTVVDRRIAAERFGCMIFNDSSVDQMADMDAFAAQIAALDAVISISNTTVHVAGALGAPCFVMLPPAGGLHWYWGLEGERTPWYDSLRLIRRDRGEDWRAQIARAAAALSEYLSARR